jgi:PhnB protein
MFLTCKLARCSSVLAYLVFLAASGCQAQDARKPNPTGDVSVQTVTKKASEKEDSRMQLTTYLLLDGTCKDAMAFYHSIFGGELTMTTVGDSPMKAAFPVVMHGRIVSARLKSKTVDISASDWLRPTERPNRGNTVMLYISGGNPDETRALFSKLSEGAEVTDPISDQPFGLYGALNDKFGNRWMFHSETR